MGLLGGLNKFITHTEGGDHCLTRGVCSAELFSDALSDCDSSREQQKPGLDLRCHTLAFQSYLTFSLVILRDAHSQSPCMHTPSFCAIRRKEFGRFKWEEAKEITFSMWTESALVNSLSVILGEAAAPSQRDQPLIPPGTVDEGESWLCFSTLLSGSTPASLSHLPCCLFTLYSGAFTDSLSSTLWGFWWSI